MKKVFYATFFLFACTLFAAAAINPSSRALPNPAQNLKASNDGMKISLSWDAPDFSNITSLAEDFDQGVIPEGWQNLDCDEDGMLWEFKETWLSPDGTGRCIGSWSWVHGGNIEPDNWLITTQVKVPINGKLEYNIGLLNYGWSNETYSVLISETSNEVAAFDKVLIEENLSNPIRTKHNCIRNEQTRSRKWFDRSLDLSEYAGKEVYLAFRHNKSKNEYCVILDNIFVRGRDENANPPVHSYNIYRNGSLIKNTNSLNFEETLDTAGMYKYEVEVLYEANVTSPRISKKVAAVAAGSVAYIRLKAANVWEDGTGYQLLLDKTADEYGLTIPKSGSLTSDCDIPAELKEKFTHFVPANADLSCMPENLVVDGESELVAVPAGVYDFCVVNPEPNVKIWIASSDYGRRDDYYFEAGKTYTFTVDLDPAYGDIDRVTIEVSSDQYQPVTELTAKQNANTQDIVLNWKAPAVKFANGEKADYSYTIFRDGAQIKEGVETPSYTDKNVSIGTHRYGVQVNYAEGNSEIIETSIEVITSIGNVNEQKPYSINISDRKIVVNATGSIAVYDLEGRQIATADGQLTVHCQPGIYVVRIEQLGRRYVEKIQIR